MNDIIIIQINWMYVYVHIAKIIFGATHVYIDIFVEHMMSNQNPRVSMRYDLLHV